MIMQQLRWLGKAEEVDFEKQKFRGKLAGLAHKYSNAIDGLIRVRLVIFVMALLAFRPVLHNYLVHDFFSSEFLIERLICSVMFILAGLLFNKYRIVAITLAVLPMMLIVLTYVFHVYDGFIRTTLFNIAVLGFILAGFYFNHKVKTLRKKLDSSKVENQLINEQEI